MRLNFCAKLFSVDLFRNIIIDKRCSQLFGEEDPDQDVSPDTADPEAAGNIYYRVNNTRYRERARANVKITIAVYFKRLIAVASEYPFEYPFL